MATEIEIQNCKKILYDELEKVFDEFLEVLTKIQPVGSVDELSMNPEIVAFFQSKNFSIELLESVALHLKPGLSKVEDAFKEGLLLGQEFSCSTEERKILQLKRIVSWSILDVLNKITVDPTIFS